MAKYLDENGLLYFWQQLKTKFVAKESGKGLSTNDYTTEEQTKLSGIATGAQVNVLEGVSVNGTAAAITNKVAAVKVPTKTSDLTNDGDGTSGFATESYVQTNGGKIDTISVNGDPQTITDKNVDIAVPTKTSDLTNDSDFITSADVPEGAAASTITPQMDGTAAKGTDNGFARGDHVHPTDTSRQAKITASGILKGNGSGGVSAAVAGTDYAAASHNQALSTITGADDLQAIEALTGTSGLLKKTAANTWALDTTTYVPSTRKVNGKALSSNITLSASDVNALPSSTSIPSKTSDLTNDSNFITQTYADGAYAAKSDISNVYKYKGSVASYADLPSSGQSTGDVYNVEATDMNYAWTGTAWDQLGATFTITAISNAEIDAILAA